MEGASVYILRCADGSFYVGMTQRSVEERVSEHNGGLVPGYTRHKRPVELLFNEHFDRVTDAIAAEKRIKGWSRAKKVAYIAGQFRRAAALRQGAAADMNCVLRTRRLRRRLSMTDVLSSLLERATATSCSANEESDMHFVITPPERPFVTVAGEDGVFPVRRVWCVGRNYADHAREMGHDPDREPPFFFAKPGDAVTQDAVLPFPTETEDLHHEVELVVAIGTGGQDIPEAEALAHVYGYAVGLDMTRRDIQAEAKKLARPWDLSKGFDQSCPISAVVPAARIGHPAAGKIEVSVNGTVQQSGDLAQMIWTVPEAIAFLSRFVALAPGDLLMTGTPAGVSRVRPGDALHATCEGVGELRVRYAPR